MKGRICEEVETKYSVGLLVTIWLREEEELKRGPRFPCCPPITGWVVMSFVEVGTTGDM